MLDLGFQELIVIFAVALLVFGPKKIPELSRTLGKAVRELKTAIHGVKESMEEAGDEAERIEKDISGGHSEPLNTVQEEKSVKQKDEEKERAEKEYDR